ncbi:MAG: helix-turn-helix transcriptional regulator [Phyllobacteriaceae bacterium]|nr:helix-turn-helix transcriptional regulator [Phyllobacteriaceae bacterium]
MNPRFWIIIAILAVQVFSAVFFIGDILSSYLPVWSEPLPWEVREWLEIGAAAGLTIGVGFGLVSLWRIDKQRRMAEERLRRASSDFSELLLERFAEWRLTPAEADVALFAVKGLSTAEIATLRGTSEGTIKAQTNAIYRKAGVANRPQLLSLFIDDLMRDDMQLQPPAEPTSLPAPEKTI